MLNIKLWTIFALFVIIGTRNLSNAREEDNEETSKKEISSWYRLPENILPEAYELWILPQLAVNNFTYEGKVVINVSVVSPTDSLIVNVDKLIIDRQKSEVCHRIFYDTCATVSITNQELDTQRQAYVLTLGKKVFPGRYTLSLFFIGEVLEDLNGFYRSAYESSTGNKRWLGVTQFSSIFARRAFPCFDEPYMKATFRVHVGHYANETVTGNTKAEKVQEIKPGYFLTTFEKTPPMSTYLVGWAVHDFTNEIANSTMFSLWTRESMRGKGSQFLSESSKIYEALEKWISVKNPIRKMEQIAVPDFLWSAMENWGMVTFRESAVIWENGVTHTSKIHNGLITMAHEYAHTWFGNLVTPKFWNVAWLKEGFATFFAYYAIDLVDKEAKIMDLFSVEVLQYALLYDSLSHERTMNGKDVAGPENIPTYMDFVTYKKGASIIRMVYYLVGDEVFQLGLQSYVATLANRFAIPNDFYEHIQLFIDKKYGKYIKLRDIVESWANQPGYPIVTVTRNYSSVNLAEMKQEKMHMNRSNVESEDSSWWIPINFEAVEAQENSKNEVIWMRPEDKIITVPTVEFDETIICNVDQIYYYRVNYDLENWQRLARHLKSATFEKISPMSRASLIDDSFNLARAGYIDYSIPLELSKYLIQETDYEPWLAATTSFDFLNVMLTPLPDVKKAFELYVNRLIEPMYKKLSLFEDPLDRTREKLLRSCIYTFACSVGNADCTNSAIALFKDWLENKKRINPDVKNAVYCTGLRSASSTDWQKVLEIFLNTELHSEQELLISGLGCTSESVLVQKFLNYSLHNGPEVRKQYRMSIFNAVLEGSPKNVEHALDFLNENLERIVNTMESSFLTKNFEALKTTIVFEKQLNKLVNFVGQNEKLLGSHIEEARKTIKVAKGNIAWIEMNGPKIGAVFI